MPTSCACVSRGSRLGLMLLLVSCGGANNPTSAPSDGDAGSSASDGNSSVADGAAFDTGTTNHADVGAPDGTTAHPVDASMRDAGTSTGMITCSAERGAGTAIAPGTALPTPLAPNPSVSRAAAALATLESPQCASTPCGPGDGPTQILTGAPGASWNGSVNAANGYAIANAYLELNVGKGPSKLMVTWAMTGYPDYAEQLSATNWGILTKYTIDVSSDGINWQNPITYVNDVNGNAYRTREHVFDFAGMSWVRFTMNGSTGTQGQASINAMGFYDVSNGSEDTWAFAGGGPGRATYGSAAAPTFPDVVHGCHPSYMPATLNISGDTLDHLDTWLTLNPDIHFWAIDLSLDSANYCQSPGDPGSATSFSATMQSAIDKIKAAGHVPILPRIQYVAPVPSMPCPSPLPSCSPGTQNQCPQVEYSNVPAFNAAIDRLVMNEGLLPAPDMYAWFQAHPAELCQAPADCEAAWLGIEPGPTGVLDILRMWAASAEVGRLYAQ